VRAYSKLREGYAPQTFLKKQLIFIPYNVKISITGLCTKGGVTMPNIKSAKKRVKVSETKALRNKANRTALKTSIRKADAAIAGGSDDKQEALGAAIKSIDKAVSKGILHKNTAARRKSRLVLSSNKTQA
jgi:small subunit ribosomal protein S20